MTRRNALLSSLAVFARKLFGQTQHTPVPDDQWKAEITRGIGFFKAGQYEESADAFGRAVTLNPNDPIPHLYLGLAWLQRLVPNGSASQASAAHARDEFGRALAIEPSSWPAMIFMAQLEQNIGNSNEARQWCERSLQLDPVNADVYTALGALDMRADLDRALTEFQKALEIDPEDGFPMLFLDAVYRARGDEATAAQWRSKATGLAARTRWPSPLAGTWQIIRDWTRLPMALPPPPPPPLPPPPPPPRSLGRSSGAPETPRAWVFRHVADPDGDPPMLVHPIAQQRELLRKIDPIFPPNAQGTVRIGIVVAKDGNVRKATFVDGDAALAKAAIAAVSQWTYHPTISNWEPVEVRSEVVLNQSASR